MEKLKVIDFYADWCGPCHLMEPIIEQLKKEMGGKVVFEKIDVDSNSEAAGEFGVLSIPTFVIMKGKDEVGRMIGYQSKEQFRKKIESYL